MAGKMLLFLNSDSLWQRVLRRAIVIGFFTLVSIVVREALIPAAPTIWIPILTAVLSALDKFIREEMGKGSGK